jgi:hypothetical protein
MMPRQSRWWQEIMEYDIKLEHVPGSKLIQADALSRRSDHVNEEEAKAKNLPQTMITKDMIIASLNLGWATKITELLPDDKFANVIKDSLKHGKLPIRSKFNDWKIDNDVIRYQGHVYVPEDKELRNEIIKSHHDPVVMGHPGRLKTLELIRRDYYWPSMMTNVSKWIEGCALCQQMKVNTHPTAPGIMPIKSHATRPFEQVSMDFITDLPLIDGFDSVLTVVNQGLTKGVIFIPCKKTFTAMDTANSYINNVYKRFGLPTTLISDRGPQFTSKVFEEICKIFGINHKKSTAFHPQTDGESERLNQELETYLHIYCADHPKQWKDHLPLAEFAHNQCPHQSTKMSPFEIMFGIEPVAIPTAFPRINVPAAEERFSAINHIRDEALAAHELARQLMTQRVKGKTPTFREGDLVWLDSRNLKTAHQIRKFSPR